MARTITWDLPGERVFETGLDRGVLYPKPLATARNDEPMAWNGLVSVTKTNSGEAPSPIYLDGRRIAYTSPAPEYEYTLTAYTYPDGFEDYDGSSYQWGLIFDEQPHHMFDLSYRTLVGNDVQGLEHGYFINLLYNAQTKPGGSSYSSVEDTLDPNLFSWDLVTLPIQVVSGQKPRGSLVRIDSRHHSKEVMDGVEDILYGKDGSTPKIPTPLELRTLISG